jgi:hypothetical protein
MRTEKQHTAVPSCTCVSHACPSAGILTNVLFALIAANTKHILEKPYALRISSNHYPFKPLILQVC